MTRDDIVHPEVLWAQRASKTDASRNIVYLTVAAPDVSKDDMKLDLEPSKLTFSGFSSTKKVTYKCDIEFFDELDPTESKINHTDRDIEMVLRKKEAKGEYWPRLLKEKAKVHWLKTDFDKWVDEDEQDPNDDDDWMAKAGGLGGDGGFDGIDFSKFGSGPGGPTPDMNDLDADSDDDDDEPPALEGEEEEALESVGATPSTGTKTSSGIEEVE